MRIDYVVIGYVGDLVFSYEVEEGQKVGMSLFLQDLEDLGVFEKYTISRVVTNRIYLPNEGGANYVTTVELKKIRSSGIWGVLEYIFGK